MLPQLPLPSSVGNDRGNQNDPAYRQYRLLIAAVLARPCCHQYYSEANAANSVGDENLFLLGTSTSLSQSIGDKLVATAPSTRLLFSTTTKKKVNPIYVIPDTIAVILFLVIAYSMSRSLGLLSPFR